MRVTRLTFVGVYIVSTEITFSLVRNLSTVNNVSLLEIVMDFSLCLCGLGFLPKTHHRPVRALTSIWVPDFKNDMHDLDFDVFVFYRVHELGVAY